MAKFLYIDGEDIRFTDKLVAFLKTEGYLVQPLAADRSPVKADVALVYGGKASNEAVLRKGDLTVDLNNMTVTDTAGRDIHFTPTELALLVYLIKNEHRAVSRNELLPAVWGYENNTGTRVADDTVKRIRKKLQGTHVVLVTVWGYGFKISESNTTAHT